MVTEDGLTILLARIEKLAGDNAVNIQRLRNYDQRMSVMDTIKGERDRLRLELKKAEDKVAEWLSHSESMSRLVPKARRKEIPPLPAALDDIPF